MLKKNHLTLVINPIAGTLTKDGVADWVPRRLEAMGYVVETRLTAGPGDATRIAAEAAARGDYGVLACGGDGTINEVARGLIGTETALGILPAGSGNGLARHIGVPVDVEMSLKVIEADNVAECDYGTVNGLPFFCTFGVGFDAAVSQRFARQGKRGFGTYIQSAIDEYIKYHSETYEIIADNEVITDRAFMVAVCNASQYGNNAFVAPAASIRDGLLDVTIVHEGNLFTQMLNSIELFTGSIGNHGRMRTFRTSSLTIRRSAPGPAHLDGESMELPAELEIKCEHKKLRIFITRGKPRFRPILTPMVMTFNDWAIAIQRPFRKNK